MMAVCEVCGNDYYLSFEVVTAGRRHVFDSFECAIHKLAPVCAHCSCRIIGHGIEANRTFYCCANCAEMAGGVGARDHVPAGELKAGDIHGVPA
jgi:hypothetical protein